MHGLSPPRPPETSSPPPSFHYQPVKGQALDYGRCVKSAGRRTPPRTKVELYQLKNELPCHTSKRSSRSFAEARRRHREHGGHRPLGFREGAWRATGTASPPVRKARRSSARDKAAGAVFPPSRIVARLIISQLPPSWELTFMPIGETRQRGQSKQSDSMASRPARASRLSARSISRRAICHQVSSSPRRSRREGAYQRSRPAGAVARTRSPLSRNGSATSTSPRTRRSRM